MAKKSKRDEGLEVAASLGLEGAAGASSTKRQRGFVWIRDDGAICFGDECATIVPTETGRLGLTIRPDKCGEQVGALLVDYLVRTAGKGVVIEIPSELQVGREE